MSGENAKAMAFFIPLFCIGLCLSYDINFRNRKVPMPEIVSDKADYYVYLPATFIYGWDVHRFPAGIEKQCLGFILDKKNNKIIDKTTCGVAILWMPFFLVTHGIALAWDLQPDGFSSFYQKMTLLPGVFYLVLGLFLLWKFLRNYFPRGTCYLTVSLLLAGTNLYYYGIDEGLMSHVNSFFLFSLFLFLLKRFIESDKRSYGLFAGLSVVFSLAVLIRPTNILLLAWALFLDVRSLKELRDRFARLLKPACILIFLGSAFTVFLPQLAYWKYLSGNFFFYSYPGETFSNWNHPRMIEVWFSTLNGFFLYTPLALFFLAGMGLMILKKANNGILSLVTFLLASYLFASWFCWFFGGSFGYRPLVEYYAMFSIPFAFLLSRLEMVKNLWVRSVVILLLLAVSYYNLRLTYYPRWNRASTWSWDDYLLHLDKAGLYQPTMYSYTWIQDFENYGYLDPIPLGKRVHSPTLAGYICPSVCLNGKYSWRIDGILNGPLKKVDASVWIHPGDKTKTDAILVCEIEDFRHHLFYQKKIRLDDFIRHPGNWNRVSGTFPIPGWIDPSNIISFSIQNAGKTDTTYIDDLKLRFE